MLRRFVPELCILIIISLSLGPKIRHFQNTLKHRSSCSISYNISQYCKIQQNSSHCWKVSNFNYEKGYFFHNHYSCNNLSQLDSLQGSYQRNLPLILLNLKIFDGISTLHCTFSLHYRLRQGYEISELIFQHLHYSSLLLLSLKVLLYWLTCKICNLKG